MDLLHANFSILHFSYHKLSACWTTGVISSSHGFSGKDWKQMVSDTFSIITSLSFQKFVALSPKPLQPLTSNHSREKKANIP